MKEINSKLNKLKNDFSERMDFLQEGQNDLKIKIEQANTKIKT